VSIFKLGKLYAAEAADVATFGGTSFAMISMVGLLVNQLRLLWPLALLPGCRPHTALAGVI